MTLQPQILIGDCREQLKTLPAESVQCVITSPPYWGLRDYGVEKQLKQEQTPAEYIANLVEVFKEVKRVLKNDGVLWVNLGDKSSTDGKWGGGKSNAGKNYTSFEAGYRRLKLNSGLPGKNILGLPWRLAFALQDDNWVLRQDIIWSKPNAMPESVTDRPTKTHEYIFLLSKQARYYYNADAIREPIAESTGPRMLRGVSENHKNIHGAPGQPPHTMNKPRLHAQGGEQLPVPTMRNKRTVWEVPTSPYSGAHFATFPEKLIEPMVLAGSRAGDTILDPFCGSGTTLRVALRLGRKSIGIELNPDYVKLVEERIDKVQMRMVV